MGEYGRLTDQQKRPISMSNTKEKESRLHPRNAHQGQYDFPELIRVHPDLAPFVRPNVHGTESIDFAKPEAVLALNTALLKSQYQVEWWSIPEGFLCPPIPGRADYIHYMADLLAENKDGAIPTGPEVRCFDVGVGANLIYPIIGIQTYGWSFTGSDIHREALDAASAIQAQNSFLKEQLVLREQKQNKWFFNGVWDKEERYHLTICNPPFHASKADAEAATLRKLKNLKGNTKKVLNFGGKSHELWYPGGELKLISSMIQESRFFGKKCVWFSSLVSKEKHLNTLYGELKKAKVQDVRTIAMGQGNKSSRILAWTFLSPKQQKVWPEIQEPKKE